MLGRWAGRAPTICARVGRMCFDPGPVRIRVSNFSTRRLPGHPETREQRGDHGDRSGPHLHLRAPRRRIDRGTWSAFGRTVVSAFISRSKVAPAQITDLSAHRSGFNRLYAHMDRPGWTMGWRGARRRVRPRAIHGRRQPLACHRPRAGGSWDRRPACPLRGPEGVKEDLFPLYQQSMKRERGRRRPGSTSGSIPCARLVTGSHVIRRDPTRA
jgi:hypothetical protein